MQWYVYLLIVLAALVLAGVDLVAPRLRRPLPPLPPAPPAPTPEPIPEAAPQVPSATVEAPVEVPVIEAPEPTAGRLVRLRARLVRSQSVLGRGLLAVL